MDESFSWASREVREVIGAGLVSWHVLAASQLAGAGKVAWAESLGKRRKCSWHLTVPMKLWKVSASCLSAGRSVSPSVQGSEIGHMVQRSSVENRWRGPLCFDRQAYSWGEVFKWMLEIKASEILSYLQSHQYESCSLLYKTCLFCKACKWWGIKGKPYHNGLWLSHWKMWRDEGTLLTCAVVSSESQRLIFNPLSGGQYLVLFWDSHKLFLYEREVCEMPDMRGQMLWICF